MAKEDCIEMDGTVLLVDRSGFFSVKLDSEQICICRVNGKMKKNRIKLLVGDRVKVELTPYDATKGRITWRYVKESP
jgi:translation initiation factor IF-1